MNIHTEFWNTAIRLWNDSWMHFPPLSSCSSIQLQSDQEQECSAGILWHTQHLADMPPAVLWKPIKCCLIRWYLCLTGYTWAGKLTEFERFLAINRKHEKGQGVVSTVSGWKGDISKKCQSNMNGIKCYMKWAVYHRAFSFLMAH